MEASLDANKKFKLLFYLKKYSVFIAGLTDIYKLTLLCFKNYYVLLKYQKKIKHANLNTIVFFFGFIINIFTHFYNILPKLEAIDKYEQERLKKIYIAACDECSRQKKLKYDPLSATSAINVQASIMTNEFQQLFGLMPTKSESDILGKYGSVDIAIKEFLEYCGFGYDSSYIFIASKLPQHFSSFIKMRSIIRHERSFTRDDYLKIHQNIYITKNNKCLLFKIIDLLINLSHNYWFRMYWRYEDYQIEKKLRIVCKEQYKKYYDNLLSAKIESAKSSQESLFHILSYEIYFKSIIILLDISNKFNKNNYIYNMIYNKKNHLPHNYCIKKWCPIKYNTEYIDQDDIYTALEYLKYNFCTIIRNSSINH